MWITAGAEIHKKLNASSFGGDASWTENMVTAISSQYYWQNSFDLETVPTAVVNMSLQTAMCSGKDVLTTMKGTGRLKVTGFTEQ